MHWISGSTPETDPGARLCAVASYLAPAPLKYLGARGQTGFALQHRRQALPRDVAEKMPVGNGLRLVYSSACHSGDLAADWEAVLAPAKVISFPRFSAYLEHAWFLWIEAPQAIARRAPPFAF